MAGFGKVWLGAVSLGWAWLVSAWHGTVTPAQAGLALRGGQHEAWIGIDLSP